jgi:predicted MFS family arabinose efflux permease
VLARQLPTRTQRAIVFVLAALAALALLWMTFWSAGPNAHLPTGVWVAHAAPAPGQSLPTAASSDKPDARIDYLTLAHGAIPVRVGGAGALLGASFDKALRAVDGDPAGFVRR